MPKPDTTEITVSSSAGFDDALKRGYPINVNGELFEIIKINNNTFTIRPFFWLDHLRFLVGMWWDALRFKWNVFYSTYIDDDDDIPF